MERGAGGPGGAEDPYVVRVVSDLPDPALAVSADGTIVAANDLVHRLLGYAPGALVGVAVDTLVPEERRATHAGWRDTFGATPTARPMGGGMALHARRADGVDLSVEISLAPLDGGTTVAVLRDRSEAVRANQVLQDRLEVEMLAVSISSTLAGTSGDDLERALDAALGQVCAFVGADQALLFATAPDGETLELANDWCAPGLDPGQGRIRRIARAPFGWARPRLWKGEPVFVPTVDSLPPDAAVEAGFMREHGIVSALTIPLGSQDDYGGILSLRWRREPATWDADRTDILYLLGNVFLAAHRRRLADAQRAATEDRERRLLDTLAAGVVLIRRTDGTVVSANPAAAHILGFGADSLLGVDVLSPDVSLLDRDGRPLPVADREQLLGVSDGGVTRELGFRRDDGTVVWIEVRAVRLVLDGQDHLAVSFIDVTERRDAEAQLVTRALHDPLTGLPNRRLLGEHARAALARAHRDGSTTAFVYFDLDRFKRVNDQHGHAAGDALLTAVAHRISAELRATDILARMGGDEFVAVLSDLAEPADATVLAERISDALARPLELDGVTHTLSASIGIAAATGEGAATITVDELLQHADQAMYTAKESGRARWVAWSDALVTAARARDDLELALHDALTNGDFVLHYQPVLDLRSGGVVGAEALVRWRHPERGLLPPAEFLGVAEESGLVVPLGQWVLEEACTTATTWPEDMWVSVNLSARQIGADDAASRVRDVLERTGLRPDRLHLELTETALIEGSDAALADIAAIRALGAVIGLDDFGTGYSSMTYLHTLPLSFLKVDRSFVGELDEPEGHRATNIVDMVLRLAERFDLDVIAEGVETGAQETRLEDLGCRFVQGFRYAVPLDPDVLWSRLLGEVEPGD